MTKLKIGAYIAVFLLFSCCFMAFLGKGTVAEADNLVIVLDAGHDDSHVGASGNNLKEENLNLHIALACKKELETYEGVTVYMVRETGPCPYGGQNVVGSSAKCNLKRVEFAKSVGADAYISLHNNSSTNSSARGVSVYYPTTNYNYSCGVTGAGLAKSVLKQLLTIGLSDRGISVRYSEDNTRYPDGSLADYYGVIKNSKLKGIPAIIVEHAFVSNPSDASEYLNTQAKLEKLGKLDAKGIAEYYGLKKRIVLDYSKAEISGYFINNNSEYVMEAVGVTGADSVQFAVWSDEGGQDDVCWYSATEAATGVWKATIPISNHGTEGIYRVHTYVNQTIKIDETEFAIAGPGVQLIDVGEIHEQQGIFKLDYQGVYSGTDIDSISAAVWKEDSSNDVIWIPAEKMDNGTYVLTVDIGDFNYEYGTYQVHSYIRDKNGIVKCVDTRSVVIQCPEASMEVTGGALSSVYRVHVNQVPYGTGIKQVQVILKAVVSGRGVMAEEATKEAVALGAATLQGTITGEAASEIIMAESRYEAVRLDSDSWSASVYPAAIGGPGNYKVEVYGKLSTGREVSLGEQYFTADAAKQQLVGQINTDSQTVYKGAGVEIISHKIEEYGMVTVNSWCDYASVRKALEQSQVPYLDYVAYEVEKDSMEQVQLSFQMPDYMEGKEIEVLQVITGEALQLIPLEAVVSEENRKVSIWTEPNGLFVMATRKENISGDADSNNKIELRDAQLVLRAALGIDILETGVVRSCDVNKDGVINLTDAQMILKRALGIISQF